MPVMDGLEMLKQVHTLDASIPAIVLSAFEITEEQRQSRDFGELRHELKPVSGTQLEVTLLECAKGLGE
jgi:CheY-like chemotaxis protein